MKRAQNCIEMIENQVFLSLTIPMCIWKMLMRQKQQWTKWRKEIQSFHNLTFWWLYCSISLFCVIFKHNMLNTNLYLLHCWVHLPSVLESLALHNIITVLFTYELNMICCHWMFVWSHKQHCDVNEYQHIWFHGNLCHWITLQTCIKVFSVWCDILRICWSIGCGISHSDFLRKK